MENKTICIPFNKTGYCKFGEACKYSHIRLLNTGKDIIICKICKKELIDPVYTNCNHEYCKKCVIDNDLEKCIQCDEDLYGIFYNKKYDFKSKLVDR